MRKVRQTSQENSNSFSRVRKLYVAGYCRDGRSRPYCWLILGASAERPPSNNRVARSIWRHQFGFLRAARNKSFP